MDARAASKKVEDIRMKPMSKFFRSFGTGDAFEEYYGRIVRKGGVGLPSAKEAKRDLEQARRMVDPRFPL